MENKKFIEDKLLLLTKVAFNGGISGKRFYRLSFDDEIIKIFLLSRISSRESNSVCRSLPLPHSRLWTLSAQKVMNFLPYIQ